VGAKHYPSSLSLITWLSEPGGVNYSDVSRRRVLASKRIERRLTAILAADVAGYSRLTGLDEEGTHAQLQDHLRSLVNPKIAEHRGRVVKNTGDGLLAEFSSVVDAARCAVEVQRGMAARNVDVPQEKRIKFRIGINVGDVMLDRGDIFGDGVNLAVRLEGIAEAGGICIAGRVPSRDVKRSTFKEQRHDGCGAPAKLCRELNFCGEQLAQVLVELTNRTRISTEKRKMAIDGLDRPELGIGNQTPLGLAIRRREEHVRRHWHDKGLGFNTAQCGS
jgi:class 3 adenylate cyclase